MTIRSRDREFASDLIRKSARPPRPDAVLPPGIWRGRTAGAQIDLATPRPGAAHRRTADTHQLEFAELVVAEDRAKLLLNMLVDRAADHPERRPPRTSNDRHARP